MGIIFALLTVVCWSTATLSFTKASIIYEPALVNKSRLALATLLLFIFSFFIFIYNGTDIITEFSRLKNSHWFYFGLSGLVGLAVGDYFVFKAFRSIGSTYTTLISCASPLAAAIGAYFLSGQNINIIGWLGMSITIGGIILVILSKSKTSTDTKTKLIKAGFIYALISAICQGLGLAITQMGREMDAVNMPQPYTIGLIRMLSATLIIIIADASRGKLNIFPLAPFIQNPKGIIYIIIGTISGPVLGVSFSIAVLAYLPVAEAQTIFANLPLVVMLFNTIVGHEKPKPIIWFCLLLCIGGIIVLDWREDIYQFLAAILPKF